MFFLYAFIHRKENYLRSWINVVMLDPCCDGYYLRKITLKDNSDILALNERRSRVFSLFESVDSLSRVKQTKT